MAVTIQPDKNTPTLNLNDEFPESITVIIPRGTFRGNRIVRLVAAGATAPFVVSIDPPGGHNVSGAETTAVPFRVRFRGVIPCGDLPQVFTGTLDVVAALQDGAQFFDPQTIGQKPVEITVPPCKGQDDRLFTYSVKFVCGTQAECPCECVSVRPGVYATEINIHNFHGVDVPVEKRFIPVVFAGAAVGREPGVARERGVDRIILPPHSATMDDCCAIARTMFGAVPEGPLPLSIGFLEITSKEQLGVTAVYTVSSPSSGAVSIDVDQIQAAEGRRSETPSPDPRTQVPPARVRTPTRRRKRR